MQRNDERQLARCFDLTHAPLEIDIAESARYYALSVMDEESDVIQALGTRTTGNAAIDLTVSMAGIQSTGRSLSSKTARVLLAMLSTEPPAVNVRRTDTRADAPAFAISARSLRQAIVSLDSMDTPTYFAHAPALDEAVLAVVRGAVHQHDVELAVNDARKALVERDRATGPWHADLNSGQYGCDVLHKAVRVRRGLNIYLAQDMLRFETAEDEYGAVLDGEREYHLHFDEWQEPPARAGWKIETIAANDNAYLREPHAATGEHEALVRNADGSIDLSIRTARPDSGVAVNWLAAPPGRFSLALRLFWPREAALSGVWMPPKLRRASTP